jgi:hypothetical protein
MNPLQYNKAWIAGLGPILLQVLMKIDAKVLAPIDWSMGEAFWTGVSAAVVGYIVLKVPNVRNPDAATRATDKPNTDAGA